MNTPNQSVPNHTDKIEVIQHATHYPPPETEVTMSEPVNDEIEKLRKQLVKEFDVDEYGNLNENGHYVIKRVIDLITSQTKKAELKGRIDEIKYLADEDLIYIDLDSRDISERLAELNSKLEGK